MQSALMGRQTDGRTGGVSSEGGPGSGAMEGAASRMERSRRADGSAAACVRIIIIIDSRQQRPGSNFYHCRGRHGRSQLEGRQMQRCGCSTCTGVVGGELWWQRWMSRLRHRANVVLARLCRFGLSSVRCLLLSLSFRPSISCAACRCGAAMLSACMWCMSADVAPSPLVAVPRAAPLPHHRASACLAVAVQCVLCFASAAQRRGGKDSVLHHRWPQVRRCRCVEGRPV